jgi:isocitrate lyase
MAQLVAQLYPGPHQAHFNVGLTDAQNIGRIPGAHLFYIPHDKDNPVMLRQFADGVVKQFPDKLIIFRIEPAFISG